MTSRFGSQIVFALRAILSIDLVSMQHDPLVICLDLSDCGRYNKDMGAMPDRCALFSPLFDLIIC